MSIMAEVCQQADVALEQEPRSYIRSPSSKEMKRTDTGTEKLGLGGMHSCRPHKFTLYICFEEMRLFYAAE